MGPYAEGRFEILHGVAAIIFTIAKTYLQNHYWKAKQDMYMKIKKILK
jgi:hypothetical protein